MSIGRCLLVVCPLGGLVLMVVMVGLVVVVGDLPHHLMENEPSSLLVMVLVWCSVGLVESF